MSFFIGILWLLRYYKMNIMSFNLRRLIMPKRSESYFNQKTSDDFRCGIYRNFSSLDEILIELFNSESANYEVQTLVNTTIISERVPEKVIGKLLISNL